MARGGLPGAGPAFAAVFYFGVVRSAAMADFYRSTYACHHDGSQNLCPLQSLVEGDPTIPLEGNVLGLIAFALAFTSGSPAGSRGT